MAKDRPRDVNQLAARIVADAVGQADKVDPPVEPKSPSPAKRED